MITNLQQHIVPEPAQFSGETGEITWLKSFIVLAMNEATHIQDGFERCLEKD